MGFIGTAFYTFEPDNDTNCVAATLVCNVRKHNFLMLLYVYSTVETLDDRVGLCNIFCYILYEDMAALQIIL